MAHHRDPTGTFAECLCCAGWFHGQLLGEETRQEFKKNLSNMPRGTEQGCEPNYSYYQSPLNFCTSNTGW